MADDFEDHDFEDIRNRAREEVKEPFRGGWPGGFWRLKVMGGKLTERDRGASGKGPYAEAVFYVRPISPQDDVAPAEVEVLKPDDYEEVRIRYKIPFFRRTDESKAVWFVESILGGEFGESLADCIENQSKGYEFVGHITHEENKKDETSPYNVVDRVVKIED